MGVRTRAIEKTRRGSTPVTHHESVRLTVGEQSLDLGVEYALSLTSTHGNAIT